ncbi:MAG: hypothetical protein COB08_018770 [Rhodobacteraceae bacterium]|nr:hypothetical protein [Paracoccaceae bacterium]
MDIDWLNASKNERAALYRVTRAVARASDQSVERIMEQAIDRELAIGVDYLSNFRQGKIARAKAKLIHAWIAKHHIDIAHVIAPEIFPMPAMSAWEQYLDEHAIHGKLRVARFDKSMGLVQRKRNHPRPEETLKLGEEFCFHLDSGIRGYAVAFQEYEGKLHPLPLGQNDGLATTIEIGEQFLPIDDNGRPERLSEAADLGHHRFVVIVAENVEILPTNVNPPEPDGGVFVHVIRVQFVS